MPYLSKEPDPNLVDQAFPQLTYSALLPEIRTKKEDGRPPCTSRKTIYTPDWVQVIDQRLEREIGLVRVFAFAAPRTCY